MPKSFVVLSSKIYIVLLLLAPGDRAKAIETFKKALSLKIIPETKEKLENLLKEKK